MTSIEALAEEVRALAEPRFNGAGSHIVQTGGTTHVALDPTKEQAEQGRQHLNISLTPPVSMAAQEIVDEAFAFAGDADARWMEPAQAAG